MSVISKRIDYKEKEKVQSAIRLLDDIKSRKRAYVSLLALNSLISYLKDRGVSVNKTNNCWNNPLILNEFDIADIKLDNNISIDVRTIVDDNYPQMWIPKDHRAYELSPDIYVGARVNKKLDRVELIGFIESKELLIATGNKNYFFVDSTDLRPISDLLAAINTITPKQSIHLSLDHNNAKELFLSYLDNTLSGLNKEFLKAEDFLEKAIEDLKYNNQISKVERSEMIKDLTNILNRYGETKGRYWVETSGPEWGPINDFIDKSDYHITIGNEINFIKDKQPIGKVIVKRIIDNNIFELSGGFVYDSGKNIFPIIDDLEALANSINKNKGRNIAVFSRDLKNPTIEYLKIGNTQFKREGRYVECIINCK